MDNTPQTPKTPKKISTMTDSELIAMIHKASAELMRRAGETPSATPMQSIAQALAPSASAPAPAPAVERPPENDVDFVMYAKRAMQKGEYLKAHERERVAAIAQAFPEWAKLQEVPTTASAGEWRRAATYATAGRAKER